MMTTRPDLVAIACALGASIAAPAPAGAQEDAKHACASAFTSAQRLIRAGSLLEAKKKLIICGGPECPAVMHPDCQQWLSNVEASLPTVVFQVSSSAGAAPENVRVSLDGNEAVAVDGRALPIDPGEHEAVFEAAGFRASSRRIVVLEGEKLRREGVVLDPLPPAQVTAALPPKRLALASPPAQPKASSSRRLTLPTMAAGAGAVVGGAGLVYFGLKARSDERGLDSCRPGCAQDQVDHVKREYLLANLSMGLAVVGATTAVLLFVFQTKAPASSSVAVGLNAGPDHFGLNAVGGF